LLGNVSTQQNSWHNWKGKLQEQEQMVGTGEGVDFLAKMNLFGSKERKKAIVSHHSYDNDLCSLVN